MPTTTPATVAETPLTDRTTPAHEALRAAIVSRVADPIARHDIMVAAINYGLACSLDSIDQTCAAWRDIYTEKRPALTVVAGRE